MTLSDPKNNPYPIVPTTLLGPEEYGPFVAGDRSNEYVMIESTPLYVGSPVTFRNQTWSKRTWLGKKTEGARTVGGLVEPFAFGMQSPPQKGIPADATVADLEGEIKESSRNASPRWSVPRLTLASSYFVGGAFADVPLPPLGQNTLLGLNNAYFSPSSSDEIDNDGYLFGDGGTYENVHITGLIQRGVKEIVVFLNTNQPLHTGKGWNATSQDPTSHVVDDVG